MKITENIPEGGSNIINYIVENGIANHCSVDHAHKRLFPDKKGSFFLIILPRN